MVTIWQPTGAEPRRVQIPATRQDDTLAAIRARDGQLYPHFMSQAELDRRHLLQLIDRRPNADDWTLLMVCT